MMRVATLATSVVALIASTGLALAYVGPGAGLGAIGAALGLLAAIVMAFGVILFWPIRRLIRRIKRKSAAETADAETADSTDSETER